MQRITLLVLAFFCANTVHLSAQSGSYPVFYKIVRPSLGARDTANMSFVGVARHSDGGYVFAGNYENAGNANDILLMKTDASGNIQWTKVYGRRDTVESAESIRATPDGGFVIGGTVEDANQSDMLVMKVNGAGVVQWQRGYGTTNDYDDGYAVEILGSGKILLAGRGYPDATSLVWGAMVFLTANGVPDYAPYLGKGDETSFQDIARTSDKGAVLTGTARRFLGGNTSGYDPVLVKVDSEANVVWSKRFNMAGTQLVGIRVRELPNGGYLVIGSHVKDTTHGIFVIKTNALGVAQSIKLYSSSLYERPFAMVTVTNGTFNIAGSIGVGRNSAGATILNGFQMQIDSSGAVRWAKIYGDSLKRSEIHSIFYNNSGGFTLAGETYENAAPLGGATLIQTNFNGTMGAGCTDRNAIFTVSNLTSTDSLDFNFKGSIGIKLSLLRDSALTTVSTNVCVTTDLQNVEANNWQLKCYPNPVNEQCTIVWQQYAGQNVAATLLDATGRSVWTKTTSSNECTFDTQALPNGLYVVSLTTNGGQTAMQKILVLH